jgi:predicted HNH restriction endonuclease
MFVHIHHVVSWAEGGRTDLDNLAMLCGTHHRRVHEDGWTVRGHPDRELTFHAP